MVEERKKMFFSFTGYLQRKVLWLNVLYVLTSLCRMPMHPLALNCRCLVTHRYMLHI